MFVSLAISPAPSKATLTVSCSPAPFFLQNSGYFAAGLCFSHLWLCSHVGGTPHPPSHISCICTSCTNRSSLCWTLWSVMCWRQQACLTYAWMAVLNPGSASPSSRSVALCHPKHRHLRALSEFVFTPKITVAPVYSLEPAVFLSPPPWKHSGNKVETKEPLLLNSESLDKPHQRILTPKPATCRSNPPRRSPTTPAALLLCPPPILPPTRQLAHPLAALQRRPHHRRPAAHHQRGRPGPQPDVRRHGGVPGARLEPHEGPAGGEWVVPGCLCTQSLLHPPRTSRECHVHHMNHVTS